MHTLRIRRLARYLNSAVCNEDEGVGCTGAMRGGRGERGREVGGERGSTKHNKGKEDG